MIDTKATGEHLRKLCKSRSVTISQIQKQLNIGAFQSVYNWFSGRTMPSLENFYELSKLLCVPMNEMIIEKNPKIVIDSHVFLEKTEICFIDDMFLKNCVKRFRIYNSLI